MKKEKKIRLLKINKNFAPIDTDSGDEIFPNGIFVFNISKIIEYIKEFKDKI